jgi:hypothetical protein
MAQKIHQILNKYNFKTGMHLRIDRIMRTEATDEKLGGEEE